MDIYTMRNKEKYTASVRQNGVPIRPTWAYLEPLNVRERRRRWAEYVRLLAVWQRQQEASV